MTEKPNARSQPWLSASLRADATASIILGLAVTETSAAETLHSVGEVVSRKIANL